VRPAPLCAHLRRVSANATYARSPQAAVAIACRDGARRLCVQPFSTGTVKTRWQYVTMTPYDRRSCYAAMLNPARQFPGQGCADKRAITAAVPPAASEIRN